MPTYTFDHVHLRSPDPETAAQFYVGALGATIEDRVRNGASLRVVVALGTLRLFIEEVSASTPAAPQPPHQGLEHIGLQVTDMDAAVAELRARGVQFRAEPTTPRPGLRIAFIAAPDGVTVEILQRG